MSRLTKSELRKLKKLFYELMKGNIKIKKIDEKLEIAIEEWLKTMRTIAG